MYTEIDNYCWRAGVAEWLLMVWCCILNYCWVTALEYEHQKHIFMGKCTITMACGTSLKLGYKPEDFIMKIGPLIWNSELKDCILYPHTTCFGNFNPDQVYPWKLLPLYHFSFTTRTTFSEKNYPNSWYHFTRNIDPIPLSFYTHSTFFQKKLTPMY